MPNYDAEFFARVDNDMLDPGGDDYFTEEELASIEEAIRADELTKSQPGPMDVHMPVADFKVPKRKKKPAPVEKAGKSGYGPGKNPNSHKRRETGFAPKGHDSLSEWKNADKPGKGHPAGLQPDQQADEKAFFAHQLSKAPAPTKGHTKARARGARENAMLGRAPDKNARQDAKVSLGHVRQYMQQARAAKASGLPEQASTAARIARKEMKWARSIVNSKVHKRISGASGYAPGKHPNSHRRSAVQERRGRITDQLSGMHERLAKVPGDTAKAARGHIETAKDRLDVMNHKEALQYYKRARNLIDRLPAGHRKAVIGKGETVAKKEGYASPRAIAINVENAKSAHRGAKALLRAARVTKRDNTDIFVPIVKADAKEQVVYGWASPVKELGSEIIDRQGDVIDMGEVRQAAHEFMLHKRVGGSMHKQFDVGQVVESVVFDSDIQKALGIDLPYEGWFIGVKVSKKEDWDKVVSGEYTGFSIGGSGVREPMEETVTKARSKSGYGPGKNPASHSRRSGLANRTGKTSLGERDRELASRMTHRSQGSGMDLGAAAKVGLKSAKQHIVAARRAKEEGNLGAVSYHARAARRYVRSARGASDTKGVTTTQGTLDHIAAHQYQTASNTAMRRAKEAKQNGYSSAYVSGKVKQARVNNQDARAYRNKARVTKRRGL